MIPQSDTAQNAEPMFERTRYSNLWKSRATGVYFIRAKVGGRQIRDSLETKVEAIAKAKLDDRLKRERARSAAVRESKFGKMTMDQAIRLCLEQSEANHKIKPRTKTYHRESVAMIRKLWPEIDGFDASKITQQDCQRWAAAARKKYSPTRYNGQVDMLRSIFNVAIQSGARLGNPADAIQRMPSRPAAVVLPSRADFERLLEFLDTRKGAACHVVRFLAYSGGRITESLAVKWSDVDLDKGRITFNHTKNGKPRSIPIFSDLRRLLTNLRNEYPQAERVLPIVSAANPIAEACAKLGLPRLSHHDFRHLFATRCIESGVDIPTVARWLGHLDGGALAMRVYGHLRDEHSDEMAKRVKF